MREGGDDLKIDPNELKEVIEKITKELEFKEQVGIETERKLRYVALFKLNQWKKLKEIVTEDKLKEIDVYELILTLYWVLHQSTADENDEADSRAISSYARGLRLLAKLGLFKIEHEYRRRVIGKFVPLW